MKTSIPTCKQAVVPQTGVIRGGFLDGWPYTLRAIEIDGDQVNLMVTAQEPGWPFPSGRQIRLTARDYDELVLAPADKVGLAAWTRWLTIGEAHPCAVQMADIGRLVRLQLEKEASCASPA